MPQATTNDVISATFALVITCLPLAALAMIVLQWQKELNAASRMRRAAAWRVERSSPISVPPDHGAISAAPFSPELRNWGLAPSGAALPARPR